MTQHSSSRALVVAFGIALFSSPALCDVLSDNANFNIPAQSVRSALIEFSKQADVQVMGSSASFGNLQSTEVKGKLRAREALAQLLQNTGLRYEALRHAVVVRSIVNARVEAPPHSVGTDIKSPDLNEGAEGPISAGKATPRKINRRTEELVPLGSMTVTGTHIRGSDVIGSQLIVMDRQAIAKTGYATVQDVVRALPQVFGGGASEDTATGGEAAVNTARSTGMNLRGLGAASTLVLINGRRLASSGSQSSFVDVSNIPLAAVARIEVLTDGASAIYGSDAVGGVINFIMRDDYQGAETQANFGSVTDGSLQETDVSQLLGTRWPTGHVTFSYEYYHRDALPTAERRLAADSDLRRFGGTNFSSQQSSPGTILIGGQSYAIPGNQNGVGLSPASLVPGTANFQNLNEDRDILSDWRRHSGFLTFSQSLGDSITLSGHALYARRRVDARNTGIPGRFAVPASNPFRVIPAGVSASDANNYLVQYNFGNDLGPRTLDVQIKTFEAGVGATVKLPGQWEATGSVAYSGESIDQKQKNSVSPSALAAALADPNPLTAFNPFGDGSSNTPATLDRIRRTTLFYSDSGVKSANVIASGGLFALPGGEVRLAVGADYREQYFQTRGRGPDATSINSSPRYERHVTAGFAELLVPIVSHTNRFRGMEGLQLSLAGRYDDYSDFGTTLNPRFGAEWSPVSGFFIHGNWGKSFKAPNLPDLDERGNLTFITMLQDPQAASGQSPVLAWLGKNSELNPESATTWSAGIKWAPASSLNPVIDLSWFNIRFKDRIQAVPVPSFLSEERFAGIVTRNPTLAMRENACRKGVFIGNFSAFGGDCLTAPIAAIIDTRTNNTSRSTTSGLDLTGSLDTESRWGRFELTGNISYLLDFSEAQTPAIASVSLLDTVNNPLRFRMRDGISWSRAGFGAAAFVNYAGGYRDNVSVPSRDVGSWTTLDLQLSYDIDAANTSWLAGCSIALSVQNLFDTDPPFVNDPSGVGYDRENADLLNRFVSLRVRKGW